MNRIKRMVYFASALALTGTAASCEHDDIYEPLEFSVRLAPENTYRAGEPVVFEFGGNADFITVWNGEAGHEYRYRDRTLAPREFRSATLRLDLLQQYGDPGLEIYMSDDFPGLGGRVHGDDNANAEADRTAIRRIVESDFAGWEKFDFEVRNESRFHSFSADISGYDGDFTFLLRFRTPASGRMRTYYVNPAVITEFDRYGTCTWKFSDLSFVPFRTEGLYTDFTPYVNSTEDDLKNILKVNQNGIVKFGDGTNPVADADIAFQGFTVGGEIKDGDKVLAAFEATDQWVVMKPFNLYTVPSDTGTNIKGVTDDVRSYEHTYERPGTYTATFVVSSGNYMGESKRTVREVTFTVVEDLGT